MILKGDVYSKVLGMETGITIITPKNYRVNEKYKLGYLFHGLMNNNSSWLNNTMLNVYLDKYNMIVVMPETQRGFYSDMEYGFDYFKYISEELPTIIESTFNISDNRDDIITMGASMGGYGALKLALSKPEKIGHCFTFAAATLYMDELLEKYKSYNGKIDGLPVFYKKIYRDLLSIYGSELKVKEEDQLIELAKKIPDNLKPNINMFCGLEDNLLDDNRRFQNDLKVLGYNVIYNEFPGEHDWCFFDKSLKYSLEMYFENNWSW